MGSFDLLPKASVKIGKYALRLTGIPGTGGKRTVEGGKLSVEMKMKCGGERL
jgi:hypothetical protein